MEWWIWPIALFVATFAMGIVAVLAGVGGGVLFVPIVSAFFPFHLDFVRAAGLMVALTSAPSAAPTLLSNGLANPRLAMPLALVGSIASIVGALVGLALPMQAVQVALGLAILAIALVMWRSADRSIRTFAVRMRSAARSACMAFTMTQRSGEVALAGASHAARAGGLRRDRRSRRSFRPRRRMGPTCRRSIS